MDDGKAAEEKKDDSKEDSSDSSSDTSAVEPVVVVDPVAAEPVYWIGTSGKNSFNTGLDNGSGTSGIWTFASDFDNKGRSTVTLPSGETLGLGDDYVPISDENVELCQGICGAYTFEKNDNMGDPFFKWYFLVAGLDDSEKVLTADASSWDVPSAQINKAPDGATVCKEWRDFGQLWSNTITTEEVVKNLASISFKFKGRDGLTGAFNITKLTSYTIKSEQ